MSGGAVRAGLLATAFASTAALAAPPGEHHTLVRLRDADGKTIEGPVRGDAFPLWPARACYTWVVHVGGAERLVNVTERQTTPGPTRFDVGADIRINDASDATEWTRRMVVRDGAVAHTWCVNDADPPGEYHYRVDIDGRFVAAFRFCGIKLPEGAPPRLGGLSCAKRFLGS